MFFLREELDQNSLDKLETMLGQKPSDFTSFSIIESLFGKYKIFSSFSPCSEINEMTLTLILSTISLTPDQVLQAMETIHLTDVNALSKQLFGQSILSKRKVAFQTPKNYTKVALFYSRAPGSESTPSLTPINNGQSITVH